MIVQISNMHRKRKVISLYYLQRDDLIYMYLNQLNQIPFISLAWPVPSNIKTIKIILPKKVDHGCYKFRACGRRDIYVLEAVINGGERDNQILKRTFLKGI